MLISCYQYYHICDYSESDPKRILKKCYVLRQKIHLRFGRLEVLTLQFTGKPL